MRVRFHSLVLMLTLSAISESFGFDTTPFSSGPLNFGGVGDTASGLARAAAAEARGNINSSQDRLSGQVTTTGAAGCVVNIGGTTVNGSIQNGIVVNRNVVTGSIVTVCR